MPLASQVSVRRPWKPTTASCGEVTAGSAGWIQDGEGLERSMVEAAIAGQQALGPRCRMDADEQIRQDQPAGAADRPIALPGDGGRPRGFAIGGGGGPPRP